MPDVQRFYRLGLAVAREIYVQLMSIPPEELVLIAIETPVMNKERRNVVTYRKQVSTLYAIEHEILRQELGNYLVEINPTESKLRGVGNGAATKEEIILASPFAGSGPDVEAMADAWMHARAGRLMPGTDLVELPIISRLPYVIEAREDVL